MPVLTAKEYAEIKRSKPSMKQEAGTPQATISVKVEEVKPVKRYTFFHPNTSAKDETITIDMVFNVQGETFNVKCEDSIIRTTSEKLSVFLKQYGFIFVKEEILENVKDK